MDITEIFSYEGDKEGAYAASHYFDTPAGVVLFDGQLLVDQAEDLMLQIKEDIPGGELSSVFVTSPGPEHYAALATITKETQAKVYSAKATQKKIASTAADLITHLKDEFGPRAPGELVLPGETIRASQQFRWKDLSFQFLDIGVRDAAGNLVCYMPQKKRLFTGDLVFNKVHPFMDRVNVDRWLQSLDILSTWGAKTVYPGHGQVVGGDIFTHLKRYLNHFRLAVARVARTESDINDGLVSGVLALMTDKYPEYRMPDNLVPGIVAEFKRQKRQKAA